MIVAKCFNTANAVKVAEIIQQKFGIDATILEDNRIMVSEVKRNSQFVTSEELAIMRGYAECLIDEVVGV